MTKPVLAMLASLAVGGCTTAPLPDVLSAYNPADPVMGIRDTHYHSVVVDFHPRQAVDPQNWRQLNDSRSPANQGAGS